VLLGAAIPNRGTAEVRTKGVSDGVTSREPAGPDVANGLIVKLRNLGLDSEGVRAFLSLVKCTRAIGRGDDIVRVGNSQKILTVLLSGVACRYRITDNGRRQIFAFQYPGDFCDYYRYVMPQRDDPVAALTDCFVGVIPHEGIERIIERHPQISRAFWRNTVLEARIFEERVLNGTQRPAVERIANLLCEQIFRLEAVGIVGDVVPLTQIDLADAAGLSVVHVNRTIQDLRDLGALSKNSHGIRVENKDRLVQIAKFDASYLRGHLYPCAPSTARIERLAVRPPHSSANIAHS